METTEGTDAVVLSEVAESEEDGTKTELERLMEEKQSLQTQLVQIQSMLYLVDSYIAEELLRQVEVKELVN
jgi:flagellar biosynthesis chaperone FliJ